MALLTIQTMDQDGLTPVLANSDAAGDTFSNQGGDVFLLLENPGASTGIVTIAKQGADPSPAGYGKVALADEVYTLLTGEQRLVGPFSQLQFNDSSGLVNIAYSGAGSADIDVAAVKSPNLSAKY